MVMYVLQIFVDGYLYQNIIKVPLKKTASGWKLQNFYKIVLAILTKMRDL
jgi:hypothetical protein